MEKRQCKRCGIEQPILSFAHANKTKRTRRLICNKCRDARVDPINRAKNARVWARARRLKNPVRTVYQDTRKTDRKRGWINDLTLQFVQDVLAKSCSYCGSTEQMGLDRIDNSLGHLQANVVPACSSCNFIRKDMPYEAWLVVAAGIKEARETGLLKGWIAKASHRKSELTLTGN